MIFQQNSLRQTILIFIYSFVVGLCLLTFASDYYQQRSILRQEFIERGKALAKNFVYNSRVPLQNHDQRPLYALMDSLMQEPDVRWIAVEDTAGNLLVQNGVNETRLYEGDLDSSERIEVVKIKPLTVGRNEKVLDIQVQVRVKVESASSTGASELDVLGGMDLQTPAQRTGPENKVLLGIVHLGLSLKNLQLKQQRATLNLLIIFVVALVLSTIAGLSFSNSFLQPINQLVTMMKDIASSRGDLTRRIELNRKDELGQLATSFNHFIENIRQIVIHTISLINQMSTSLEEISSTAQELNASSEHINENVQSFTRDLQKQDQETTTTTTTISQVASTLLTITRESEQATRIFEDTEVVSKQGRKTVQDSIVKINSITDNMTAIANRMQDLTGSMDKIGAFVEAIQSIASQTNLLSLNAAIEAARAGESGRGFSVVAEEVRKLAENASSASKQIQALITRIMDETRSTGAATQEGTSSVQIGRDSVLQAGEALDQIMLKTNQASVVSVQVAKEMQQQSEILKSMMERVGQVQKLGRNNFSTAQSMATSVEEQTASLEQITRSIQDLSEDAIKVKDMIVEFKVQ
jgi:methyl-accepting chemotaxis protein